MHNLKNTYIHKITMPELRVWWILEDLGFMVKDFKQRTSIDPTNCFYAQMPFENMRLDYALPSASLAIEVNGAYWHGNHMTTLTKMQAVSVLNDAVKREKLAKKGWKVLTVTDDDPKIETLKNRIWDMLDV